MKHWMIVALPLVAAMGAAGAQTAWPAGTADNQPAASLSTRSIRLPADVRIAQGAPAVADARGTWLGGWRGWACRGFECDVGLVVEDIRGDEATAVVALAAGSGLDLSERVRARFVGDELQARLSNGTSVRFRQRADRGLDFMWQRPSDWVAGVLTKNDTSAADRQRAAQAWLSRGTFDVNVALPAQNYTVRVRPTRGASDFLAGAGDECLTTNVPTRLAYNDPYVVMQFQPQLRGCNFSLQYRADPVTGKTSAFRSEDGGASWRQIASNGNITLR